MDKYIEVIKNLLPLLDTMEEAISYLKVQISELRYEEAFVMIKDINAGVLSIEKSIEPMMKSLKENRLEHLLEILKEDINEVLNINKNEKKLELDNIISKKLILDFSCWKTELADVFKIFTVS